MNERETERRIRQTIDRGLSGMEADPWLFQRVQRRKEEEPMESHMSMRHRPAGGTLLFRTLGILLAVIIGLGGMLAIRNPIGLSGLFRPVDRVSTQASEQPMAAGQGEDSLPAGAVSQTEHSAGSLDRIDLTVDPDLLWNEDYGILAEGPEIDKSSLPFQNATYRKLNQVNQAVEGEMTYTWADSRKDPWHSRILLWTEGDGYTLDMPQKSLGIMIEKGCLFFEDRKNAENCFLTLRNAGMDGNYTRLADGVQSRLIEKYSGLKILTLAWRPVSVYLNGEYWGHYNLRENLHDSFMIGQYEKEHVYLYSSDEAQIVEGLPVSGRYDNLIYQKLMDQLKNSDPANRPEDREYLEQHVDVDSYLNWLALKIYFGDSNAAGSFAAYRLPTGKWKCAAVGFDWGLFRADYNAFESFLKPEGLGAVNADNTIFLKILEIDEYRELFLKKLGGLYQRLTAEVMQAELDRRSARTHRRIHRRRCAIGKAELSGCGTERCRTGPGMCIFRPRCSSGSPIRKWKRTSRLANPGLPGRRIKRISFRTADSGLTGRENKRIRPGPSFQRPSRLLKARSQSRNRHGRRKWRRRAGNCLTAPVRMKRS